VFVTFVLIFKFVLIVGSPKQFCTDDQSKYFKLPRQLKTKQ